MNFLIEFDYLAEEEDELSVQKGDIVNDVRPYEDGWMIGIFKGKQGVFPSNFGKQVPAEKNKLQSNNESIDIEETIPDEPKPQPKKIMGVGFGDIFSGKQIQLKHANLNEQKKQLTEEDPKPDIPLEKKIGIKSSPKVELVKATFQYKAENSDELDIEEGDIITIIDKKSTDEGWWKGKLNGNVGVFPNNFVVPVSSEEVIGDDKMDNGKPLPKVEQTVKPVRPPNVAKTPPPLPLTAKPITNKPKMTPAPVKPSPEPVKLISKPSLKSADTEYEEINFESPVVHKPLVGPNAERVRRQNIRPPKKNSDMDNDNEDKHPVSEIIKTEKPLESAAPENNAYKVSTLLRPPATKEKLNESTSPDPKLATSTTKTSALKEKFSEPVSQDIKSRDKFRDPVDSIETNRKGKFIQERSKENPPPVSLDSTEVKSNHRPKSQMFSGSIQTETDHSKAIKSDDQEALKKKILILESKVSSVEEDNLLLRKEMADMTKFNNEQISNLTNIINKLLADFDEEKIKRKAGDLKLAQLKDAIDEL